MAKRAIIDLDKGWETIQGSIDKLISFVDAGGAQNGEMGKLLTTDYGYGFIDPYTMVYNMCMQKPSYEKELYSRYDAVLRDYVRTKILPAVRGKSGELLLREMAKRWQDYKFIKRQLSGIFRYLERHYIPSYEIPTLENTANLIFQNLISEDREGNPVDRAFIKAILEIVWGLGYPCCNPYDNDFEPAFLDSSCAYYDTKMDKMPKNSQYRSQVLECLRAEKLRAKQSVRPCTAVKLLKELCLKFEIPLSELVSNIAN